MKKLTRKIAISGLMVVIVALAFASKGGGDKRNGPGKEFTPIRSLNTFTLKTSSLSSGNYSFYHEKETNRVSVNSFVTFQKGNSIFILPYKYKVNMPSFNTAPKTNLQFIGVKIKMPK
jgi:hypothetical protein